MDYFAWWVQFFPLYFYTAHIPHSLYIICQVFSVYHKKPKYIFFALSLFIFYHILYFTIFIPHYMDFQTSFYPLFLWPCINFLYSIYLPIHSAPFVPIRSFTFLFYFYPALLHLLHSSHNHWWRHYTSLCAFFSHLYFTSEILEVGCNHRSSQF